MTADLVPEAEPRRPQDDLRLIAGTTYRYCMSEVPESGSVLVVPAVNAYPEYLEHSAYVCQPRRYFRPVERMAFYRRGEIKRQVPLILKLLEEVEFTRATEDDLRTSADPIKVEVANLIRRLLRAGPRQEGERFKVVLLSRPDDPRTILLDGPILNDATAATGRTIAWVRYQRYAALDALLRATRTSELSNV